MSGRGIVIAGVSSAGKSSVVAHLQSALPDPFLHVGIDHFFAMFPDDWSNSPRGVPGAGFWYDEGPDASGAPRAKIRYGDAGARLLQGMRAAVGALLDAGNDVIVDEMPLNDSIMPAWRSALATQRILWVRLSAPIQVLEQREQARTTGRKIGNARGHIDVDHGAGWDLDLDTAELSPSEVADRIVVAFERFDGVGG